MHQPETQTINKPSWLKVKFPSHQNFFTVSNLLKKEHLHTICQSAKCPNIGECWSQKTATFLILGDTCTRNCGFCAVKKGSPLPPSSDEPQRVARAAELMGLGYVVVTSVTRDDLPDGGAPLFSKTIAAVRKRVPQARVEALIPDFKGDEKALKTVMEAHPDILNHNLETPEVLYPQINRSQTNYKRSLKVLKNSREMGAVTKSGLMVGLGERKEDILRAFAHLREVGCDLLTVGQYLRPSKKRVPVRRYYSPQEFEVLKRAALDLGFKEVESGPLVRSSYKAHKMFRSYHRSDC
ncbi:MAG: lipoyl synthase [Candidatus Aminicenantes bacterium]